MPSALLDFEIPGYDIIEAIGRGGMASVYRARQHTFDRNVALKILKPDLSEDDAFCQRFVMESLIVAKLNHSHIVQVYDVGEVANHYYIAMEFLSGGDLHTRLKQGLPPTEAIWIVKQIASALDFAHRKNIIHRDLKPDNVMFREDEAAVLTDFGIAKETDADVNLTQTGLIVGTPKYMSPEQIRGAEPSPAADIYSLGIMFYQLLCNRVPFDGPDLMAIAYKHFNDPVPDLPPHLSHLQDLLEHMLAKNAEDRIVRGKEIIATLERVEREHPIGDAEDLTFVQKAGAMEGEATVVKASAVETKISTSEKSASAPADHATAVKSEIPPNPQTAAGNDTGAAPIAKPGTPLLYVGVGAAVLAVGVLLGVLVTDAPPQPLNENLKPADTPTVSIDTNTAKILQLLDNAEAALNNRRLTRGDNNALDFYEQVLRLAPDNEAAIAGKKAIAMRLLNFAETDINQERLERAQTRLDKARDIDPELDIRVVRQKLERALEARTAPDKAKLNFQIPGLMALADDYERQGKLFSPAGANAAEVYRRVLAIDPRHRQAQERLAALESRR